jgi:hypothetical protein
MSPVGFELAQYFAVQKKISQQTKIGVCGGALLLGCLPGKIGRRACAKTVAPHELYSFVHHSPFILFLGRAKHVSGPD